MRYLLGFKLFENLLYNEIMSLRGNIFLTFEGAKVFKNDFPVNYLPLKKIDNISLVGKKKKDIKYKKKE